MGLMETTSKESSDQGGAGTGRVPSAVAAPGSLPRLANVNPNDHPFKDQNDKNQIEHDNGPITIATVRSAFISTRMLSFLRNGSREWAIRTDCALRASCTTRGIL